MEKIFLYGSIIVAVIIGLILVQHFFLTEHENTGIMASDDNKSSDSSNAEKTRKVEEEMTEPLKTFTGDEYTDPTGLIAVMETSMGTIKIKFFPEVAPNHVQNFIHLANKGFFNGLIFHRVIDGFVIQGGCPDGTGSGGPGYRIAAEFNDYKHETGVLSMARAQDPDSAGSQFFICLEDQPRLDGKYTVFGTTIEGLDVVKAIGKVKTNASDKPLEDVVIKSVKIIKTQ